MYVRDLEALRERHTPQRHTPRCKTCGDRKALGVSGRWHCPGVASHDTRRDEAITWRGIINPHA